MITLLTDFGTVDPFVGVMKGVIAGIAPNTPVVDLTHEVPVFSITEGAFLLEQSWRYFPVGTVHVAVVDPGVGSERRGLVVELAGHFFVGPDNGIFSAVLRGGGKARVLDNPSYWLPAVSATFHGRDVFAPVAAQLAAGVAVSGMGTPVEDAVVLMARPGVVLHVDRFGNVVLNLRPADWTGSIEAKGVTIDRRVRTYTDCAPGELCVIEGSGGYLEISVAQASAAERLGLRAGDEVRIARVT